MNVGVAENSFKMCSVFSSTNFGRSLLHRDGHAGTKRSQNFNMNCCPFSSVLQHHAVYYGF